MSPGPTAAASLADLQVSHLGPSRFTSPLSNYLEGRRTNEHYVDEDDRVLLDDTVSLIDRYAQPSERPSFEPGGPRRRLFFESGTATVGIVTCGGLCPGLNDVIRGLVHDVWTHYGVRRVIGFRYGYAGLIEAGPEPLVLTPESVESINEHGGTMLGTSRGAQPAPAMADTLVRLGVDVLFVIGGDGSMRGAGVLAAELRRRELPIGVIGIPKTIDNDIPLHRAEFRVPNGIYRRSRRHPDGPGGGAGGDRRCRPGQSHGPSFRLHRLLFGVGLPRRRFRADPRG